MKRLTLTLLPALLAACANPSPPQRPEQALPAAYAGQAATASPVLASDWWKGFGDSTLDGLVDRALAANLDLRLAAARVDEAAVAVGLARAAQWPGVDLAGGVSRSRSSTLTGQGLAMSNNRNSTKPASIQVACGGTAHIVIQ